MQSGGNSGLVAVLLVTSSERGTNLAFAWPRRPKILKRYSTVRYYASQSNKYGEEEDNRRSSYAFERSYQGSRSGPSNNQPDSDRPHAEHLKPRERDHQEEDDSDSLSSGEFDALSDTASDSTTSAASDVGPVTVSSRRKPRAYTASRDASQDEYIESSKDRWGQSSRAVKSEGKGKGADRGRRLGDQETDSGRDRKGRSPSVRPRGAPAPSSDAGDGQSESATGTNQRRPGRGDKSSAARARAFTSYLEFPTDVLAAFLAPRRELCQQKFELVIDDLAFLGHPICADESGSWVSPDELDDTDSYRQANRSTTSVDQGGRGRSMTSRHLSDAGTQESRGQSTGGSSARSGRSCTSQEYSTSRPPFRHRTTTTPTSLNLFNLVLVLSRPSTPPVAVFSSAPSSSMALASLPLSAWLQFWHDNVVFKMAAGLFAEQCRCGYVESEADKLAAIKDRCIEDGASFSAYASHALGSSSLARSLRDVYSSISRTSRAFVSINDRIDAHLQLPPIVTDPSCVLNVQDLGTELDWDDPLLLAGEGRERGNESVDGDDVLEEAKTPAEAAVLEFMRTTGPFLLPWKTLLLLRDRPMSSLDGPPRRRLRRRDTALPNNGNGLADESDEESSALSGGNGSDSHGHDGIETWGQRFTKLLKPTVSGVPTFAELADLLGWDLYRDVYPMVRHLIYYGEARVIDVPRTQGIYHLSPLFDFRRLPQLSIAWSLRFPRLMPLAALLSAATSSVQPFGSHFTTDAPQHRDSEVFVDAQGLPHASTSKIGPSRPSLSQSRRELCLNALIWLLRQEVVVQIHMRLRLVATDANKRQAAELRTERLLKKRRQQAEKAAKMAHRQRKAAARAALGASLPAKDKTTNLPVRGKQEGGAVNRLMDEETRGRSRSRSRSSTRDKAVTRDSVARPESGLAFSKPIEGDAARSSLPDPSSAEKNHLEAVLRFERRPVLRSRSPSTLLRKANPTETTNGTTEAAATSVPRSIPRSTDETSRPATPRGRWTAALPPSEPHSSSQSFSGTAVSAMLNSRQSRSRSQARMRVTGFGEDEEVTVRIADTSAGEDADMEDSADEAPNRRDVVIETEDLNVTKTSPAAADRPSGRQTGAVGQLGLLAGQPASGVSSLRASPRGSEDISGQQSGANLSSDGSEDEVEDEDDNEDEPLSKMWDFVPSLIAEPSRASSEENEWIAAMLVGKEALVAQWFVQILPYLNGKHTLDEIVYREELRRRDLRVLMNIFKDEIIAFTHP